MDDKGFANAEVDGIKRGFLASKSIIFVVLFGVIGCVAPWFSIYVATFRGITDISLFNSTMLMILSLLVVVLLVIESASALYNGHKRDLIIGLIFAIVSLVSFLFNLLVFIGLK